MLYSFWELNIATVSRLLAYTVLLEISFKTFSFQAWWVRGQIYKTFDENKIYYNIIIFSS